MVCPLKMLGQLINQNAKRIYTDECSDACAWWDAGRNQCCLKTLSQLKVSGGLNTHSY